MFVLDNCLDFSPNPQTYLIDNQIAALKRVSERAPFFFFWYIKEMYNLFHSVLLIELVFHQSNRYVFNSKTGYVIEKYMLEVI